MGSVSVIQGVPENLVQFYLNYNRFAQDFLGHPVYVKKIIGPIFISSWP